jgi:hypothetical protein
VAVDGQEAGGPGLASETGDGTNTFTWDAERRMTTSAGVTFTFDGNFERVMDTSPKLYWYSLGGSVLAETDGSGNPVNEYIYFDGMRIARRDASGNVYYSFGNELGSPTVTTATGSLCYWPAPLSPHRTESAIAFERVRL